MSVIAL